MSSGAITLLVVAICLIPLAGIFAAMDAALQRVSKARVEEMRREGAKRAAALEEVVQERARHVALLLLLRIACEMVAAVLVTVILYNLWGSGWRTVLTVAGVMTVVLYVLVGVGPRTLGRQHAYGVALATAGVVRLLGRVLGPVATLLILIGNALTPGRGFRDGPFSSEVELRELVDMAEERGVVESGERQMIHSVFELGDTIAREVMVPRTDVVWIERTKTVRQALALWPAQRVQPPPGDGRERRRRRRRRLPQGPRPPVAERPRHPRPEGRGADAAADVRPGVQAGRRAAARHAGPADPHRDRRRRVRRLRRAGHDRGHPRGDRRRDRRRARRLQRPPVEELPDGSMRVTARLPVQDLAELFAVELPEDDDVETVGGLLARALGRVPIEGAKAEVGGLRLVAESTGGRRNRIDTLLVCRVSEIDEDDDQEDAAEPEASTGASTGATRYEEPARVEG